MRDVSREEKKYILTVPGALSLRHALSQVLHLDPHNGPEGYIVRSVYFDTLYDTDFYQVRPAGDQAEARTLSAQAYAAPGPGNGHEPAGRTL